LRQLTTILSISLLGIFCFAKQDKSGKTLFNQNCGSCHRPNNTLIGPPFQRIREDYGLQWTVKFVRDNQLLLRQKDIKAQYIYLLYNKALQPKFSNLTSNDIVKILDYVDTFPYDSTYYSHRKVPDLDREKYIKSEAAREEKQWQELKKSLEEYSNSDTTRYSSGYSSGYGTPAKKTKASKSSKRKNGM
jgi:hypothetical protein